MCRIKTSHYRIKTSTSQRQAVHTFDIWMYRGEPGVGQLKREKNLKLILFQQKKPPINGHFNGRITLINGQFVFTGRFLVKSL